jgi:hypothetical protein
MNPTRFRRKEQRVSLEFRLANGAKYDVKKLKSICRSSAFLNGLSKIYENEIEKNLLSLINNAPSSNSSVEPQRDPDRSGQLVHVYANCPQKYLDKLSGDFFVTVASSPAFIAKIEDAIREFSIR